MRQLITRSENRFLLLGFLLAALVSPAGAQTTAQLQAAVAQAGGRVIVTLRSTRSGGAALMAPGSPAVSADELQQIQTHLGTAYSASVITTLPATSMVVAHIQPSQVAALLADSNVAAIEPDRIWFPADVPNPSTGSDLWSAYRRTNKADTTPWGVAQVTAPAAWALGFKGDNIKVGVLDSGGDATHPDLSYAGGYDAVNGNSINWNDDVASCGGHGTHIAGTIAAKDDGVGIVGVAPHVRLYAIKVFQEVGGCGAYTSVQIAGVNWAVSQGIRLVNVSIAGSYSAAYDAALQVAATAGTYVIAAAGNAGGAVTYPGSSQYTIAIAALDASNTRASWSDFGPEVDFSAPGVSITSTMPGGAYGDKSGTSMATPHALGVAALILSSNPSLSFDQLRQKLMDGALDLESNGFDNNTGYGLVRAANSLSSAPAPLTLAVSPTSRRASVQQNSAAPADNAAITLAGSGAASANWSATKRKSWTTLTAASGTGSGTVSWSRNATGLAVGTYVDTITVSSVGATGSPNAIVDTLVITAPPPPLTMALSPGARIVTVQQGGSAAGDNATLTFTGTNAGTAAWSATKRKAWTTLGTVSGTGSGTVTWTRATAGLAVGTYVDTITVTAPGAIGSPNSVFDTIVVTAPPPPLVLALSPASRSVSVVQGGSAPGDNGSVTLTGTNASTTAWNATKRKSWTTLVAASGTGNGTVSWTRNASGLTAGTYVDTISVTAPAASGSPGSIIDTMVVTAPLSLALSPVARNAAAQQGTAAPGDNATVTLSGTGSASTVWTATKRKAWTTLGTASGTGSGTVTWARNTSGLTVGTYVDTITVTAPGAAGSPSTVFDTLRITAVSAPLSISVSPGSRRTNIQANSQAPSDNALVTLSGNASDITVWSASSRHSWTVLTYGTGIGTAWTAWNRNSSGLVAGTYVDTITVTAPGSSNSAMIFDTLVVSSPLTIAVSPTSRLVAVQVGGAAPGDNATVTLSGTGSASGTWSATKRKAWTTLTNSAGTGSGSVTWNRSTSGLAAGIYVDTITVTSAGAIGSPTAIYDTLQVTAAPPPLTLAVSPLSRNTSVQQGSAAAGDNATVTLSGTNASNTAWSATKRKAWTTLGTASGTGSGTVTWSRNATGLAVGTYVDTIAVTAPGAAGSPSAIYDTLVVTAAPTPLTLAVSPPSRHTTVQQGGSAAGDNGTVTLSGSNASTAGWSASKRQPWTTLVIASGTGSGTVSWARNATGLAVGTYVDTITVTASGANGSPTTVVDSLVVTSAPVPLTLAVSPNARSVSVSQGGNAPSDNGNVILSGTNANTTVWTATRRKSWTTLTTASGTGSGTVTWTRATAALGAGTYVDTITVTASGASGSPTTIFDTIQVSAAPLPLALAVSPRSRKTIIAAGNPAPSDNAAVTLTGDNAATTGWSAAGRKSWTLLTYGSGVGSGTVAWNRNSSGLGAGTYVDTITVTVAGQGVAAVRVIDTLVVNAVPVQVQPKGKKFRMLTSGGPASIVSPILDSALVVGAMGEGVSDLWSASAGASWLQLLTTSGHLNEWIKWQRLPAQVTPGIHVDTVRIAMLADLSMETLMVDTLEVVAVASPPPAQAVDELYRPGAISDDQRALLDHDGNNNGRYDLGDFLAWVDHNHIRLSAAIMSRVQGLIKAQAAGKPVGGGGHLQLP